MHRIRRGASDGFLPGIRKDYRVLLIGKHERLIGGAFLDIEAAKRQVGGKGSRILAGRVLHRRNRHNFQKPACGNHTAIQGSHARTLYPYMLQEITHAWGDRVLDLGCGTGTMTEILAEAGYDMIGVDNSGEMLAEAMEKRVESGHDILYLLQDMQEFELYGTVRAVVSVCDSLNYITEEEELEHVFALVNNYLDPGGLFIFDMNTIHKYQDVIGDTTIAEDREDGSFIWENSYDRENALNVYELALFLPREDGLYEKCEEEHVQKAYSIEAIKAMIVKAGMELVAVCDAYTHNPGDENCERLTFVAREHGKSAQNGYHGRIPEKPETHRAD